MNLIEDRHVKGHGKPCGVERSGLPVYSLFALFNSACLVPLSLLPVKDSSPKALLLGAVSSSAYAISFFLVRPISANHIHGFEIAFFRTVICFIILYLFSVARGGGGFRSQRSGLLWIRGAVSGLAILLWFYGLVRLPLAEATTLSLTSVCFAAIIGAIFLKEKMTLRKVAAIVIAIAGAVTIIRPGFDSFQIEYLAVIAASACWGTATCLVRSAARTENTVTIALWTTLLTALVCLPPTIGVWRSPSGIDLLWLTAIGLLTALGTITWTMALRYGEATQVSITDFGRLVWVILIGLCLGEVPGFWSVVGIILILSAVLTISGGKKA